MLNKENIINLLHSKGIGFEIFEHQPFFTVIDSKKFRNKMKGAHTKNLFLKNKKNNFFLLSYEESEGVNLKKISKALNLGNVSFAREEYLSGYLGIKPGSVSPFALLNDQKGDVDFYLEKKLYESDIVNFHPLINTFTITIPTNSFLKFMIENNKKIHIFSSDQGKIIKTYE